MRPLHSRCSQHHPSLGPRSHAPGLGVTVIGGEGGWIKVLDDLIGLLVHDDLFRDRGGFDLHQLGKANAVVHHVETVAIDPAVVAACAPRGVGIEMASFLRDTSLLTVGLMPDRALGFAQTLGRREVFRGQAGIKVFGLLTHKGDAVWHDVVERSRASRQGGAMGHLIESKDRAQLGMPLQPAALGFTVKDVALLHDDKEHEQSLMLIDQGMSSVATGCVMLPQAFKQGKQHSDIVGKGRFDHGGAFWKVCCALYRCASFTAPCAVGNTFRLCYPFGHFRLLPTAPAPRGGSRCLREPSSPDSHNVTDLCNKSQ